MTSRPSLLLYASGLALAAPLLALPLAAQPAQPVPTASQPEVVALAVAPHHDISNGSITARLGTTGGPADFYTGTRFDQAGQIFSLKLNGREFYGPWYDALAPEVLDYTYDASGQIVGGLDSAVVGPVEEFAPLNFTATAGSQFVKIGVGVLDQPDTAPYDHYRHYKVLDRGRRTTRVTPHSVTYTQALSDGDTAYVYAKTLELTKGNQLLIRHSLKNTGKTAIHTTVYDHNFLTLVPGDGGLQVSFPFTVSSATPPDPDVIRIEGKTLTYLRPLKLKERLSFPVAGFRAGRTQDYDFLVTDTATGAGVRVQGDQPLIRINTFSIDKVQAIEPYIAIDVAPGQEKSWTYRYTYTAPKR